MITKLWNLIGVKRTVNGIGEIEYARKNMWLNKNLEYMLEVTYLLGLWIVVAMLLTINVACGCWMGLLGSIITMICGALLIHPILNIIEGYYSAWKPLW